MELRALSQRIMKGQGAIGHHLLASSWLDPLSPGEGTSSLPLCWLSDASAYKTDKNKTKQTPV